MINFLKKTMIILLFTQLHIIANTNSTFESTWESMQKNYKITSKSYNASEYSKYCHPDWKKNILSLKNLINGAPNRNFLSHSTLIGTMVRNDFGPTQKYEITYLKECLSQKTRQKINLFKDVDQSWLTHKCKEFDCSINSLGLLYYSAKILEKSNNKNIDTIVEFGGGYGNLARIFKLIEPKSTIFIIDLPELIALQEVFLKTTLPEVDIIVHDKISQNYKKNAIHLIPVYLFNTLQVEAEVFVSTFGISETTPEMQSILLNKNFFNANICYISGQLPKGNFTDYKIIFNGLRSCYQSIDFQPFHFLSNNELVAYETIATR